MKRGRTLRGLPLALAALVCGTMLFLRPARLIARGSAADPRQEIAGKKPSAGDAYMNVQVLKDIPSDQLIPSMRYIRAALGVECTFCHDPKSYENDDKPEKNTARNMMKMMFAINRDNFNGRREVTCYTCHRGAAQAANMPTLSAAAMMGSPGAGTPAANGVPAVQPSAVGSQAVSAASATPTPSTDEILAKYMDALGGAAAVQGITTLHERGSLEMPSRNMKVQAEMLRKAPDKQVLIAHLPNGEEFAWGFNGTAGWQQEPGHGADDLSGDELVRAKEVASFIAGLHIKQEFSRVQVAGRDRVGDREAYRVVAFRSGGGQVRFYFDTQSGLLLRVSERIESPLGALPEDTDYSDYREVSGVKLPFTVTEARVEGPTTFRWEQIQANTTVEDAHFDKPRPKAEKP